MDCNKEDAIKAMQLAERKMQVNDFIGARKLAQKAQQLFPGLDNLSQLLAVCEVHCCPAACPVPNPRPIKELIDEYGSADEEIVRKLMKDLKGYDWYECDRIKAKGSTPAENLERAREFVAQALFYQYLLNETEEHEHEQLKKQVGDLTAHRSYLEQENSRLHREMERLNAELKKRDRKVEQFKDKAKGLEEENTKLRSDLQDEQNKSRGLNDLVIEFQARVIKQHEEIARMKAIHLRNDDAITSDMKHRVIEEFTKSVEFNEMMDKLFHEGINFAYDDWKARGYLDADRLDLELSLGYARLTPSSKNITIHCCVRA